MARRDPRRFGPGRVRRKLAEKIVAVLSQDGFRVRLNPEHIRAAEGHYRTNFQADCYRWEAGFELAVDAPERPDGVAWVRQLGFSYSRMTDCVRGMTYDRSDRRGWEWDFAAVTEPTPQERHRRLRTATKS